MMKNVDDVCRHIDPLIHRYLVDATAMRFKDILFRSVAYNFDVFHDVLTHVMIHNMMLPQISTLYPLFPLLRYSIIIQFGFLPSYNPYPPPHLLRPFREL